MTKKRPEHTLALGSFDIEIPLIDEDNGEVQATSAKEQKAPASIKNPTREMASPKRQASKKSEISGEFFSKKELSQVKLSKRSKKRTPRVDPLIGRKFGNVEIVSKVGQGGFGRVYEAKHVFVGKPFAVKVLKYDRLDEDETIERFQREAQALSQINHPNIVQFHDFGEIEDYGFYLVMERLQGESLQDRIRELQTKGKLFRTNEIKNFIAQLCDALDYVHKKGVVHRDLKPSNIFLHAEDERETIKLFDFGIAALTDDDSNLTGTGKYIGTANYIAPEQIRGRKDLDGRADLYALAVILYFLLTGKLPFKGQTSVDTIFQQVHLPPPALSYHAPERKWEQALEDFMQTALAKNREERPPSALVFKDMCLEALEKQHEFDMGMLALLKGRSGRTHKMDRGQIQSLVQDALKASGDGEPPNLQDAIFADVESGEYFKRTETIVERDSGDQDSPSAQSIPTGSESAVGSFPLQKRERRDSFSHSGSIPDDIDFESDFSIENEDEDHAERTVLTGVSVWSEPEVKVWRPPEESQDFAPPQSESADLPSGLVPKESSSPDYAELEQSTSAQLSKKTEMMYIPPEHQFDLDDDDDDDELGGETINYSGRPAWAVEEKKPQVSADIVLDDEDEEQTIKNKKVSKKRMVSPPVDDNMQTTEMNVDQIRKEIVRRHSPSFLARFWWLIVLLLIGLSVPLYLYFVPSNKVPTKAKKHSAKVPAKKSAKQILPQKAEGQSSEMPDGQASEEPK